VRLTRARVGGAPEGRKKVVEELASLEDHLDVLVNNSGYQISLLLLLLVLR
jgi:NAD(P)-dependent dehydrogenase (short-subunit alcohol dehydrogenase family)